MTELGWQNGYSTLLLCLLLTTSSLAGCLEGEDEIPDDFYGDDIYPVVAVEPFLLIDQNGDEFDSAVLDGKVVIVVFMFTRCPDVCPLVSANVKWLYSQLTEAEQADVEVLSITVDPWMDNSTELAAYMEQMSIDWFHLTGEVEDLEPVWGNFDVGLKTVSSDEYGYTNNTSNSASDGGGSGDGEGSDDGTTSGSDETSGRENGLAETSNKGDSGDASGRHHPEIDYLVDHSTGTILVDKQGNQRVWWGDVEWVPDQVLDDVRKLISE